MRVPGRLDSNSPATAGRRDHSRWRGRGGRWSRCGIRKGPAGWRSLVRGPGAPGDRDAGRSTRVTPIDGPIPASGPGAAQGSGAGAGTPPAGGAAPLKVSLVSPADLGPAQLARWSEIQASAPVLDSPFFAAGFVRSVADARERVEVAVLEDSSGVAGFFPFERGRGDVAHPVGRMYSDFQAVIAGPAARWDGPSLLRACGL